MRGDKNRAVKICLIVGVITVWVLFAVYYYTTNKSNSKSTSGIDWKYLDKTTPEEILYDEVASYDLDLKAPSHIAIQDSIRVLSDTEGLHFYSSNWEKKFTVPTGLAPTALAIDANDTTLWVAMQNEIVHFSIEGKELGKPVSLSSQSTILSMSPTNEWVYFTEQKSKRVFRWSKKDNKVSNFPPSSEVKPSPFHVPSPYFAVAVSPSREVTVVNPGKHQVMVYNNEGEITKKWGEHSIKNTGFCGCCNPAVLVVNYNNEFVTSEKGLVRVKLYSSAGNYLGVVAPPSSFSHHSKAPDVAVQENQIYILDRTRNQVRVFAKK